MSGHYSVNYVLSIMNNFLNRSQEDKGLSKWGWEREITEYGIVYMGWEIDEEFSPGRG